MLAKQPQQVVIDQAHEREGRCDSSSFQRFDRRQVAQMAGRTHTHRRFGPSSEGVMLSGICGPGTGPKQPLLHATQRAL